MTSAMVEPADTEELRQLLRSCGAEKRTVEIGGRFSKRAMGGAVAPADVVISTARLNRLAQYEPRDLTVSVEAGYSFQKLVDRLAENRQMLPLDPPLPGSATIGGVIAANCCGPRRRLYGSARDMVIGMSFVTVEGKEVNSGGMVVKNVAGLDMAKLLIGSFGTLAAISRVNLRLHPLPPREETFLLSFATCSAALQARDVILRSFLQPAAIDLLNPAARDRLGVSLPDGYVLLIHAGGVDAVLTRYTRELEAIARNAAAPEFVACGDETAGRLWRAVRDFSALRPGEGGSAAILRLSTTLACLADCFAFAGSMPVVARAGSGIAYVHCDTFAPDVLQRARSAGLYTVVESSSAAAKKELELWADPGPELETMRQIKRALDPGNLLNHGRLYNHI